MDLILLTDQDDLIIESDTYIIKSILINRDKEICNKSKISIHVNSKINFKAHELDIVLPYFELLKNNRVYSFDNYNKELTDEDFGIINMYNINFPYEFSCLDLFDEYKISFKDKELELMTILMLNVYRKAWRENE